MYCCTFFGHRNCSDNIEPILREVIIDLIANKNVTCFLVGDKGNFDGIARKVLKGLMPIYPQMHYSVILAYLPLNKKSDYFMRNDFKDAFLPAGFENVPPQFALDYRNHYMLKNADYVVTYITNNYGGAAKFAEKAENQQKKVINIAKIIR